MAGTSSSGDSLSVAGKLKDEWLVAKEAEKIEMREATIPSPSTRKAAGAAKVTQKKEGGRASSPPL